MAYTQTSEDLRQHLQDSVQFLAASSAAYDDGAEGEAKRIATTIRVLVHDTRASTSLLGQLGVKTLIQYMDTSNPIDPSNLLGNNGLVMIRMTNTSGSAVGTYIAPLDNRPLPPREVAFPAWWSTKVTKDTHGNLFSRRDFVLALANKVGGVHVDPTLDASYVALTRHNSLGWTWARETHEGRDEGDFEGNVAYASVRQIGHEMLCTLRRDLAHLLDPAAPISDAILRSVGRNDPCPCGSGKKLKKCHAA